MANVTKPIALNETFKTTESTSRNLADVLAQALQALNTTISGLNFINCVVVPSLPTTGISTTTIYLVPKNPAQTDNLYDEYINLTGTSAGWEKIGDTEIDLSDYYNKTETDTLLSGKVDKVNGKGLSTNDYTTAEKTKLAGIEAGAEVNPTSGVKTATESFETVDGGLLSKCMIDLVPVQSGSGDPYPAGGGKNKAITKSSSFTSDNVTFTINSDGSIKLSGTADETATIVVTDPITVKAGIAYTVSIGASGIGYGISGYGIGTYTITPTNDYSNACVQVKVVSGTTYNTTIYPMIEVGSSATSYAPYSNVRPISGHTEVDLLRCGKNLYDGLSEIGSWVKQRCTAVFNGDGSITITNTQSGSTWLGFIGTLGTTVNINNCSCSKGDSFIVTSGNYTVCSSMSVGEIDSNNILLKSTTITSGGTYTVTEDDTTAIVLRYNTNLDNGASGTIYPMIRKSTDTDSTFEPYLGHLYQVKIGSTVYGGTVDFVTGEMTVDRAYCKLADQTLVRRGTNTSGIYRYAFAPNPAMQIGRYVNVISNALVSKEAYASYERTVENCITPDANGNYINFYASDKQADTDWITFATNNDIEIVYPIATPQTIQLTPQQIETLAGQNNLSTPLSGQSIETNGLEYKELFTFADVKEYVDKKIPDAPTTDGTYTLQAVVSGGVPTYSWT